MNKGKALKRCLDCGKNIGMFSPTELAKCSEKPCVEINSLRSELQQYREKVGRMGEVLRAYCIGTAKDGTMKCFICDGEWDEGADEVHVNNKEVVCFASRFYSLASEKP